MDTKTIIIKGQYQKDHAIAVLNSVAPNDEDPVCVTFEPYAKVRSRSQNALYWMQLAHISKYIIFDTDGVKKHMDRNWWHSWLALKFLEPVWIHHPITGEELPVPRSTKQLRKKEFTEYLQKINEFAADVGVVLPLPIDLEV